MYTYSITFLLLVYNKIFRSVTPKKKGYRYPLHIGNLHVGQVVSDLGADLQLAGEVNQELARRWNKRTGGRGIIPLIVDSNL